MMTVRSRGTMARLGRMDAFEEFRGALTDRRMEKESPRGEWECTGCGYVREGRKPPHICPDCGADAEEFEFWEYDEDWDDEDYD
jgi:rubrerythrin